MLDIQTSISILKATIKRTAVKEAQEMIDEVKTQNTNTMSLYHRYNVVISSLKYCYVIAILSLKCRYNIITLSLQCHEMSLQCRGNIFIFQFAYITFLFILFTWESK